MPAGFSSASRAHRGPNTLSRPRLSGPPASAESGR